MSRLIFNALKRKQSVKMNDDLQKIIRRFDKLLTMLMIQWLLFMNWFNTLCTKLFSHEVQDMNCLIIAKYKNMQAEFKNRTISVRIYLMINWELNLNINDDLKNRSLCHKCHDSSDEFWVISCFHVYCRECLNVLVYKVIKRDKKQTACLDCNSIYIKFQSCNELKELQMNVEDNERTFSCTCKDLKQDLKWINFNDSILSSSKMMMMQIQIELWLMKKLNKKIIIFTQFHML